MAISNEAKRKLALINEDILEAMDLLEELSEDEASVSSRLNEIIDTLSCACDLLDELE